MNSLQHNFLETFDKINFEQIKDHPNILIAANFWDEDRFLAAKTCYRFMRAIDDLIDNYKSENKHIAEEEREQFQKEVNAWINSVHENDTSDPWKSKLVATLNHFKIPLWTMETFARSMIYDIYHDGFAKLD